MEAFPQVGGKILIYHPNKDFTLQKKGTVVLFNDFGYLFELDLDDQDRAYIGKRRIDIETHNKLTPAERNRRRDDPVQSPLLFVPPATPEEASGKVDMACFSLLVLKSTLLLKKVKKSTA